MSTNTNEPVLISKCDYFSVFRVSGADARTFLQSQLTQDVQTVTAQQAALAGFCTAQGRLWASMLLVQDNDPDSLLAVIRSDLLESFLKRIRMFVLRSKVTFEPQLNWRVAGVQAADSINGAPLTQPSLQAAWQSGAREACQWVRLPSAQAGLARYLVLGPDELVEHIEQALGVPTQVLEEPSSWQRQDMLAGIGWIQARTQDLFIPQTLNLDLVGAVSFTKGCFPGQEVVARAHYRGTVKRRMHLATAPEAAGQSLEPGMDVFVDNEPDNPVGRIIDVVSQNQQATLLFEAPFKQIESHVLRVGSATGPELVPGELPYKLQAA